MEMIRRQYDINRISKLLDTFPVVALLGPRLCGKTTLARQLNFDHFFDLGLREHAERLGEPMQALRDLKGLIVLDEIHLMPELFAAVKNVVDSRSDARFVVLGSASLVIFRHTSRHLAGRMVPYEISGLTLADIGKENMTKHLFRGGLPGSYLAPSDDVSLRWRENYLNEYFSGGFADEGFGLSSHILERIWHIIAGMQGNPVNLTQIRRELRLSIQTAKRYLEALETTSLVRSLDFWEADRNGSAPGRPKLFIRDSGLLASLLGVRSSEQILEHPQAGSLWEAYALETLIKHVEFRPVSYAYWRDRTGRELDLVWKKGDQLVGVDFKLLPSLVSTKPLEQVVQRLDLEHLWVVHAGSLRHELGDRITALPLADMLPGEDLRLRKPSVKQTLFEARPILPPKKVFVSYSHEDDDFVEKLVSLLEKARVPVTIDWKSLRLGDSIDDFLRKSILASEATILVISKNSLRSPWVMAEFLETLILEHAENRKRLLPIYIDRSVFDPNLYLEIDSDIQHKIDDMKGFIIKALNKNLHISYYDDIRGRLLDLKNNLDKALKRLTSALIADCTSKAKLRENFPKLMNELGCQPTDPRKKEEG